MTAYVVVALLCRRHGEIRGKVVPGGEPSNCPSCRYRLLACIAIGSGRSNEKLPIFENADKYSVYSRFKGEFTPERGWAWRASADTLCPGSAEASERRRVAQVVNAN